MITANEREKLIAFVNVIYKQYLRTDMCPIQSRCLGCPLKTLCDELGQWVDKAKGALKFKVCEKCGQEVKK